MGIKNIVESYISNPEHLFKNISLRINSTPSLANHIFVIGAPRSGTTLVQSVLSAHKSISSFDNETGFFMYRDFFSRRFKGMPTSEYSKMCNKASSMIELFDEVAKFHLAHNQPATIFLEKTPQHVLFLKKLVVYFPYSKFVNVIRDVRDASVSARNASRIKQGKSLQRFVNYWNQCIDARLGVNSHSIYDLKYEEFTSSPEKTLTELMNFLGLAVTPSQLDHNVYSRTARAGIKDFEKLLRPIDSFSVGKWKKLLTTEEIKYIESIAFKNLKNYGYL